MAVEFDKALELALGGFDGVVHGVFFRRHVVVAVMPDAFVFA